MSEDHEEADTHTRLRKTLSAIREQKGLQSAAGPLAGGMAAQDRLVIATFFDPTNARRYQSALGKLGIGSTDVRRSGETQVLVDYEDRAAAAAALSAHLNEFPNHLPRTIRRDFDGLIFGIAIGISVGFVFGMGLFPRVEALVMWVPCVILGCLIGHLLDRLRFHLRTSGRIRIGVWELLIVSTLPAAIFFLHTLISSIK